MLRTSKAAVSDEVLHTSIQGHLVWLEPSPDSLAPDPIAAASLPSKRRNIVTRNPSTASQDNHSSLLSPSTLRLDTSNLQAIFLARFRSPLHPPKNLNLVSIWLLEAQQAPVVGTTGLRNLSWCYWENLRSERVLWYSGLSRINSMISESPQSALLSLPRRYHSMITPPLSSRYGIPPGKRDTSHLHPCTTETRTVPLWSTILRKLPRWIRRNSG